MHAWTSHLLGDKTAVDSPVGDCKLPEQGNPVEESHSVLALGLLDSKLQLVVDTQLLLS